jgi:lipopolysaccharide export system permease protein
VIGVSLAVFSLYYVGLIAGETLADKLILSPFWAMWMANILFTAIGVLLLLGVRKGAATTRGGDARELLDRGRAWATQRLGRVGLSTRRERKAA